MLLVAFKGSQRPIRKQLAGAVALFVRWLGRRSLVATNRTSVPLAMVSVLLTWSGWHYIQWLLPFVTIIIIPNHYTGQCVWISNLPIGCSVTPWLLASTCFYWNHRCFTWRGFWSSWSSSIDHQYMYVLHTGWAPVRVKHSCMSSSSIDPLLDIDDWGSRRGGRKYDFDPPAWPWFKFYWPGQVN